MKSPKQVINDVVKKLTLRIQNQNQDLSLSRQSELNSFDLIPIRFTGMIQDYLFRESRQIFDILKQQTDHDIEGLTYDEIKNDTGKQAYFRKIKENIPKYYCLKQAQRQKHFKIEGQRYFKKLGVQHHQLQKQNDLQARQKEPKKSYELSPIKSSIITKKQAKIRKQQQKRGQNTSKAQQQSDECVIRQTPSQQVWLTPKKGQKKRVKFFQFQYVKDFSQYKTPIKLSQTQQLIQPLKEVQLAVKKKN